MANERTFEGATARLHVDTAQAFAQLRALRNYARTVRGELAGLPPAAAPATMSPLIAPAPSTGMIPGSRSESFTIAPTGTTALANIGGLSSEAKTSAKGRTVNGVHIPDGPTGEAAKRKKGSMFHLPKGASSSPGKAAGAAAVGERWSTLLAEARGGPNLRTEDVTLGPVKVGRSGLQLRSTEALLGPAAIFGVAIYASLRGAAALGDATESVIAEAEATGRDIGDLLAERAKYLPGKAAAAIVEGPLGLLFDAAEGMGKFGVGVAAVMGMNGNQASGNVQAYKKIFSDVKTELSDALTVITGGKQNWEKIRDRHKQVERVRQSLKNEASEQALADAKKTAEQLLGMGFPGTLDELRAKGGPVYEAYKAKYFEDVEIELAKAKLNERLSE